MTGLSETPEYWIARVLGCFQIHQLKYNDLSFHLPVCIVVVQAVLF